MRWIASQICFAPCSHLGPCTSVLIVVLAVMLSTLVAPRSQAYAASERILWSFGAGADGMVPSGNLAIDASGSLYGTTANGGNFNNGIVFKVTPVAQESVLWSFGGGIGVDGASPYAGVTLDTSGNLYGTTSSGGLYDNFATDFGGTVFKVTPAGQESLLWNFGNGSDGQQPSTGLLMDSSGNLFGTAGAGLYGFGIAFQLTPGGQESIIWNFAGGADGVGPDSNLIMDASGNLYGVTSSGGTYDIGPHHIHGGTLFKLSPNAAAPQAVAKTATYTESILWNFGNGTDGQNPNNVVMDASGDFFGTTQAGGTYGAGTIFELTADGQESVLWSFGNGADGQNPLGVILDATGSLYGATSFGGTFNPPFSCFNLGCGTAFKLTPPTAPGSDWTETILWNFGNSADGFGPSSGLIMDASGNLYGETGGGGADFGGTLYEISNVTPSGQISLSSQHIQFPQTAAGGSSSVQLAIRNTGTGQLTGTIATPPAPFGLQGSGSFNLAPKTETKITLTFNPTAPTRAHQLTTVTSSSAKQSSVKLDLRGVGIARPTTVALNVR